MGWNEKTNSHYDRRNHHQNPGHQHNHIYFYNLFHQLTAKLRTGPYGASVARPAEVEPGRGREKLLKSQRMEELPVRIGRRKNLARLSHVKVIWNWTSSSFNSNIALLSLCFTLETSWVALYSVVCEYVRHRCHPTKSPLFPIFTGIQALCWPCTT